MCCLLVFVLSFFRCSSFAVLARCGFLLVRVLPAVLAVLLVCRSVGVAFLSLACRLFVRRGSSGLSVLRLFLAVRAWFLGCGCGCVLLAPPKPQSIFVGSASRNQQKKTKAVDKLCLLIYNTVGCDEVFLHFCHYPRHRVTSHRKGCTANAVHLFYLLQKSLQYEIVCLFAPVIA